MEEREFQRKIKEAQSSRKDRCSGQHPKETKEEKGKVIPFWIRIQIDWQTCQNTMVAM